MIVDVHTTPKTEVKRSIESLRKHAMGSKMPKVNIVAQIISLRSLFCSQYGSY